MKIKASPLDNIFPEAGVVVGNLYRTAKTYEDALHQSNAENKKLKDDLTELADARFESGEKSDEIDRLRCIISEAAQAIGAGDSDAAGDMLDGELNNALAGSISAEGDKSEPGASSVTDDLTPGPDTK